MNEWNKLFGQSEMSESEAKGEARGEGKGEVNKV